MAPNLLVLAHKAVKPHKWFQCTPETVSLSSTEAWSEPVPGLYKHTPNRGWTLIALAKDDGYQELETPMRVAYCKLLHKYMFAEDLDARKRTGYFETTSHTPQPVEPLTFFVLDDGVTWVQCYDSNGEFIPGPYERFVLDADTLLFRPMLKHDDPEWQARRSSHGCSAASSLHVSSRPQSRNGGRQNSFNDAPLKSRSAPGSPEIQAHGKPTLEVPSASSSRPSSRARTPSSRGSSRVRPVHIAELPRM